MNDIKTRLKSREVKVRDTAALAPKELSKLLRDSSEARCLRQREPEEGSAADSAAVREVQGAYEGKVAVVAAVGAQKAFAAGKRLAQKRYEEQFQTNSNQTARQADRFTENGQPASFSGDDTSRTARARGECRRTKAREQQECRREIKLLSERTESRWCIDNLRGQDIASGELPVNAERSAFAQSGKTAATRPKEKTVAVAASATKRAESAAAARDRAHATQAMPQAMAQINASFTAKINQIQAENSADSVVIRCIPDGGSDLSIINWPDVVAVFAVKTAGADADAADVVTMYEERVELLEQVFWDMNAVTYSMKTVGAATILHITITSKTAGEMPDVYHFNKSQRQALTEMLKPEYRRCLRSWWVPAAAG